MKKELIIIIRLIAIIVIVLVIALVICNTGILLSKDQSKEESRCSPIFSGFSEIDIEGTWIAGTPEHLDKLIIRSNGTYKQFVHVEFTDGNDLDYESDWQPWYIEMPEDSIPYLHLTNFAFCGMGVGISCRQTNGSGYDFCRDEAIIMEGEGILIILGPSSGVNINPDILKQNYIALFYPLGAQGSWAYQFDEH